MQLMYLGRSLLAAHARARQGLRDRLARRARRITVIIPCAAKSRAPAKPTAAITPTLLVAPLSVAARANAALALLVISATRARENYEMYPACSAIPCTNQAKLRQPRRRRDWHLSDRVHVQLLNRIHWLPLQRVLAKVRRLSQLPRSAVQERSQLRRARKGSQRHAGHRMHLHLQHWIHWNLMRGPAPTTTSFSRSAQKFRARRSKNCNNHADAVSGTLVTGCTCTCSTGFTDASCRSCADKYENYPTCSEIYCTVPANCNGHADAVSGTLVTGLHLHMLDWLHWCKLRFLRRQVRELPDVHRDLLHRRCKLQRPR